MKREDLAQLLDGASYAGAACRHALQDGAEFILWHGTAPADRMVPAYERRAARALADGVPTLGFTEALDGLRRAGRQDLLLGQVTLVDPPYLFMVFLAADAAALVACVGIGQRAGRDG